jgi:hypothetical protein
VISFWIASGNFTKKQGGHEMSNYEKLKDNLKKLYGLPPYNTPTNICYGDGYFAASIERDFAKEDISKAEKELGLK